MSIKGIYICDLKKPLVDVFDEWQPSFKRSINWLYVISMVKNDNKLRLTRAGNMFPMIIELEYEESSKKLSISIKPNYYFSIVLSSLFVYFVFEIFDDNFIFVLFCVSLILFLAFLWYKQHRKDEFRELCLHIELLFRKKNIKYEFDD